jgi:uncharacterized protein (UPF0548 family)
MRLKRPEPEPEALRPLLTAARGDALTYQPIGLTELDELPEGFHRDRWTTPLGTGQAVFTRAGSALCDWQVQRGSGLVVLADGPAALDVIVAMSAPLPLRAGFVDVVCRVVRVVDTDRRRGFAYGTLPVHPATGEESFMIDLADDDAVTFVIVAVSHPRHPLARAFPPVARALQRTAAHRYLDAMRAAVGTG